MKYLATMHWETPSHIDVTNSKVSAIKLVRAIGDTSLRDAKTFVDEFGNAVGDKQVAFTEMQLRLLLNVLKFDYRIYKNSCIVFKDFRMNNLSEDECWILPNTREI